MSPRNTAAAKKAAEKAERLAPGELVIRVQATEATLERLWALMMFAEAPFKMEKIETGPLPWEEPTEVAPELDIDWDVVYRSLMRNLEAYVKKHGRDSAIEFMAGFGGAKLTDVPKARWIALNQALEEFSK